MVGGGRNCDVSKLIKGKSRNVLSNFVSFASFQAQHEKCSERGMAYDTSYRSLKVWQRSMTLVEEIYRGYRFLSALRTIRPDVADQTSKCFDII